MTRKQYALTLLGIVVYLALIAALFLLGAFSDPTCPAGQQPRSVSGVPWLSECAPAR